MGWECRALAYHVQRPGLDPQHGGGGFMAKKGRCKKGREKLFPSQVAYFYCFCIEAIQRNFCFCYSKELICFQLSKIKYLICGFVNFQQSVISPYLLYSEIFFIHQTLIQCFGHCAEYSQESQEKKTQLPTPENHLWVLDQDSMGIKMYDGDLEIILYSPYKEYGGSTYQALRTKV